MLGAIISISVSRTREAGARPFYKDAVMNRYIHIIWLGKEDDAAAVNAAESWRSVASGWEVRLWRSAENVPAAYQKPLALAQTPQQASNVLRFAILETYGGLYLDRKVLPATSPDRLLSLCGESDRLFTRFFPQGFPSPQIMLPGGRFDRWEVIHQALEGQLILGSRGGKSPFGLITLNMVLSILEPMSKEAMKIFRLPLIPTHSAGLSFVAARRAACEACDQAACWYKRLTPCQMRARLKRPGMICPLGRWPTRAEA